MTSSQFLSLFLLALSYGSTLPCLIHADHVYTVSQAIADVTDSNDVKGLTALQRRFSVLQLSTDDPCFGLLSPWSWVECSNDTPACITALNLQDSDITGSLPDFSSMDALETVDFSLNRLTGPIPDFLGTLPNLTTFGTIPASIANNNNLVTYISGNPKLSTSSKNNTNTPSSDPSSDLSSHTTIGIPNNDQQLYTTGSNKKNKIGIIVGIVAGVLAIKNHNKRKAESHG